MFDILRKIKAPVLPFIEASKARRKKFFARNPPRFNLVLAVDSYKSGHAFAYPKFVCGMASYIEARTKGIDIMIPFGRQAMLQKLLKEPISKADVDQAADFAAARNEPFNRSVWEHILVKYDGFMPLYIRGVPEGMPVASGNAITTIMCTDEFVAENIFWLCSYFETALLRGEWYPTTIATNDYGLIKEMKQFYVDTGADMSMLAFAFHDFGGRGVTCHEQAEIGGAAHLVNFMGSDTIEGVLYANYWYHEAMSAYSVPATEHSVQCSFQVKVEGIPDGNGKITPFASVRAGEKEIAEGDLSYLKNTITSLGKMGGIVSIVIDGYDCIRAAKFLCNELKDTIIASGCKVVFRPDSGDMMEILPQLIELQAEAFGTTLTSKGYKQINYVGIIQGDGVDRAAVIRVLTMVKAMGYAAHTVIFGSGGALLQKVNRDTYKFAQKASAVLVRLNDEGDTQWVGIAKDPITDPGKKSKEGVLTLARSRITGEVKTIRIDVEVGEEWEDMMVDIYDHGEFFNETTLKEVRERCAV